MTQGELVFFKSNKFKKGIYEMLELPGGEFELKIGLPSDGIEVVEIGNNYFDILQKIRQSPALKGYEIVCNGTSLDVYPSAMQKDMGGAIQGYRLQFGFHAGLNDIVNIMEYDEANYIHSTRLSQREYYDRWVLSKKKLNVINPKYSVDNISLFSNEHLYFWGHRPNNDGSIGKSCLSQWWLCHFEKEGNKYRSTEQWMMAEKARLFSDHTILEKILNTSDPKEAKELGRKVTFFDVNVWEKRSYDIVVEGNLLKFSQNLELKEYLLSTGDSIIVEASPYDQIWGIGMRQDDEGVEDTKNWKGQNLLGFALMEVRHILKEQDLISK